MNIYSKFQAYLETLLFVIRKKENKKYEFGIIPKWLIVIVTTNQRYEESFDDENVRDARYEKIKEIILKNPRSYSMLRAD